MWRRFFFLLILGSGIAVDACGSQTFSTSPAEDAGPQDGSTADGSTSDSSPNDGGGLSDGSPDDSGLPEGTIVLVSGQDNPHDLIVSNGHLYWTNYSEALGHGSIATANIDGSEFRVVAVATHGNRIAFDGTTIFWSDFVSPDTTNSIIGSAPIDGGPGIQLQQFAIAPMGLAVDDQFLYTTSLFGFSGVGTVGVLDKITGIQVATIASGLDNPVSVAATSQGIVWTSIGVTPSSGQVGVGTIEAGVITIAPSLPAPWGITTTPSLIYVTTLNALDASTAGGVVAVTYTDAATSAVSDGVGVRPYFIASDSTNLYWTEEGAGIANGNVAWTSQLVQSRQFIATGQERPHGIAVDDQYVYWTSYTNGKIYRSPKP
jgi:hypothetical protein